MKPDIIDGFANRDLVIHSSELQGNWIKPGEIDLDGDNLIWRENNSQWITATEEKMHTMLSRFIKLEYADKQQILDFARRYGVLGICQHQLPATHNQPLSKLPLWLDYRCPNCKGSVSLFCTPQQRQDKWTNTPDRTYFEPIERWFYFAQKARATINIAEALGSQEPKKGDSKDWEDVREWLTGNAVPATNHISSLRFVFSDVINAWLEITGVRLMFGWMVNSTFKFASPPPWVSPTGGILPPLAVYIMLLVNRSRGLAICSNPECGSIFSLNKKQPKKSVNRGSYCPACRKGKASSRKATRMYQQRELENPNREKRKRLTPQQVKEIQGYWQECKTKERKADFVKRLAGEYGTSATNVYRLIRQSPEQ